ncbi:recombinase family protein [Pediococcus acidilactici]|uniref:recombinase family protein n=2 Tax=Pediococcus acidilactici TaxID=1254 RepID=UPI001362C310|nr:recombinase family protein [Pediococcus acidilactici]MDB8873348.1 recombinase family protein [Pediococcus acidilactici]MDB8875276.1 recombinase family protein [Pediococcus acidilactici]QHM53212.1 Putative transposon Tn552 DNA-invertase bin3 [Pediococcus acidilactici]QHM54403.1 Putative transposon Tn552 DNA-invertase bin3 [Pediococcus acidilactici]
MKYGYARVSSKDQNLARQLARLKEVGVNRIYEEKISGAINERPELAKVLDVLKPGDELYVLEMERLGRNNKFLTHIFMEVYLREAKLIILDLPTFDDIDDENMRNFLQNIFIETKKFQAESERQRIRIRQRQGIELAKKRGVYKGRPVLYGPDVKNPNRRKIYFDIRDDLAAGKSIMAIKRKLGVSRTLIYRIKSEMS